MMKYTLDTYNIMYSTEIMDIFLVFNSDIGLFLSTYININLNKPEKSSIIDNIIIYLTIISYIIIVIVYTCLLFKIIFYCLLY